MALQGANAERRVRLGAFACDPGRGKVVCFHAPRR